MYTFKNSYLDILKSVYFFIYLKLWGRYFFQFLFHVFLVMYIFNLISKKPIILHCIFSNISDFGEKIKGLTIKKAIID